MGAERLTAHIEITPGVAGGRPRVSGHRITVQNIVIWHERLGLSPDEIANDHGLSLADVHAALTYYFDHREEIDRAIEEDKSLIAALKKVHASRLAHKLRAGLADGGSQPA